MQLGHSGVRSEVEVLIGRVRLRSSAGAQKVASLEVFAIVADDQTSLAGGHRLARLVTEHAVVRQRTYTPSLPFGGMPLRSVLDDCQVVLLRDIAQRIHISDMTCHVHRNDGPGSSGDGSADRPRVHA